MNLFATEWGEERRGTGRPLSVTLLVPTVQHHHCLNSPRDDEEEQQENKSVYKREQERERRHRSDTSTNRETTSEPRKAFKRKQRWHLLYVQSSCH